MGTEKNIDILKDRRSDCYSILVNMSLEEYLMMVQPVYEKKGGLESQRPSLRTSTAKRIRTRMVDDLKKGSILPPIVVGIIIPTEEFSEIEKITSEEFFKMINNTHDDNKAIIDGMQRTTALIEAGRDDEEYREKTKVRIEFWIADNTNSLIYRMLVLNTGQVPWGLRRQLEVVFSSIISELKKESPCEIIEVDNNARRTKAGMYQAKDVIELFLAFGIRSTKVDVQEKIVEEFSRLDLIEATANEKFVDEFKLVLSYLAPFDTRFSIFSGDASDEQPKRRIKKGLDIFSSQPARIGFVVAFAREIFGRPGIDRSLEEQEKRLEKLQTQANELLDKIEKYSAEEIGTFLDLGTLNEKLDVKKGKVGEFEREFFLTAFETLISDFSINNLTSCWRAY